MEMIFSKLKDPGMKNRELNSTVIKYNFILKLIITKIIIIKKNNNNSNYYYLASFFLLQNLSDANVL